MPGKVYHQISEATINAMLAEANRMGQAQGWKRGFASAVALLVLGGVLVLGLIWAGVIRLA